MTVNDPVVSLEELKELHKALEKKADKQHMQFLACDYKGPDYNIIAFSYARTLGQLEVVSHLMCVATKVNSLNQMLEMLKALEGEY